MGGGGVVLLLVRLYALPESLILGLSFFGVLLLLLKDGRSFGGGSGGFRRLMPLVGKRATDRGESREDGEQDFGVDGLQHWCPLRADRCPRCCLRWRHWCRWPNAAAVRRRRC